MFALLSMESKRWHVLVQLFPIPHEGVSTVSVMIADPLMLLVSDYANYPLLVVVVVHGATAWVVEAVADVVEAVGHGARWFCVCQLRAASRFQTVLDLRPEPPIGVLTVFPVLVREGQSVRKSVKAVGADPLVPLALVLGFVGKVKSAGAMKPAVLELTLVSDAGRKCESSSSLPPPLVDLTKKSR